MFYRMITEARDRWFASPDCTAGLVNRLHLFKGTHCPVEAIKTYLFLKTGCENRSLAALFCCGAFNNLNLEELPPSFGCTEIYGIRSCGGGAL